MGQRKGKRGTLSTEDKKILDGDSNYFLNSGECCFIKRKDTHTSDANEFCLAELTFETFLKKAVCKKVTLLKSYCHSSMCCSVSTYILA